jgi:ribosomal protein S12 methylthiotransferase
MAGKTIALVSLGCAKNAVDLQVMSGNLLKKGWALSSDPDRADVVIVNTCSFIESAREEAEAEILRAVELKKRGNYGRVVVTGCYPQRYPELKGAFPGVDEWGGVPQDWIEPRMPALRFTGRAFAYLKIAEGCFHACAFCAIPGIRGKFRSRPIESIVAEARALVADGYHELDLVAQDVTAYGRDIPAARPEVGPYRAWNVATASSPSHKRRIMLLTCTSRFTIIFCKWRTSS